MSVAHYLDARASQFVGQPPPHLHLNRLVEYLELYRLLLAGDGESCDAQIDFMLGAAADSSYGTTPQPVSHREAKLGRAPHYERRPASRWPHTFTVLEEMARVCGKEDFIAALLSPASTQIAVAPRACLSEPRLDVPTLRERFAREHLLALPPIFAPGVLQELAAQVELLPFQPFYHASLGVDHSLDFGLPQAVLQYLVTDRRVLAQVEAVCAMQPGTLNRFAGRIYQIKKGRDEDGYHSDVQMEERRMVALSIPLTRERCQGGRLLLRKRGTWWAARASAPAGLGEITLFRISRRLQHRVSPVTGEVCRTNFAGWFCGREGSDYDGWLDAPVHFKRRWLGR